MSDVDQKELANLTAVLAQDVSTGQDKTLKPVALSTEKRPLLDKGDATPVSDDQGAAMEVEMPGKVGSAGSDDEGEKVHAQTQNVQQLLDIFHSCLAVPNVSDILLIFKEDGLYVNVSVASSPLSLWAFLNKESMFTEYHLTGVEEKRGYRALVTKDRVAEFRKVINSHKFSVINLDGDINALKVTGTIELTTGNTADMAFSFDLLSDDVIPTTFDHLQYNFHVSCKSSDFQQTLSLITEKPKTLEVKIGPSGILMSGLDKLGNDMETAQMSLTKFPADMKDAFKGCYGKQYFKVICRAQRLHQELRLSFNLDPLNPVPLWLSYQICTSDKPSYMSVYLAPSMKD